jgi:preprotein translocase subunit SecE
MVTIYDAIQFVKEVRVEFSKVAWPTMQEFLGSMLVVFIFVCCFMVYLGFIDFVLTSLAKRLFQYATYFV